MPMIPYLVSNFEKPTISNLVMQCFGSDFPDIFKKPQVSYIFNYLEGLGAESVLLEMKYLDKDYLEDFSRYYVKRFGNDGHLCARMHFFATKVDHRLITEVLEGGVEAEAGALKLDQGYLGFMVIKPLPKTFIGKTCLKVMSDDGALEGGDKRKRRISRNYLVDLFGIKLNVRSIAFQEQDKVVAACATTALWSALHCLKWRDVRSIRSCSEITVNAINHVDGSPNSFPNKELSNKQILRTIDVEGLRHHSESLRTMSEAAFISTVIGHIDSHLPLLVTGGVYGVHDESGQKSRLQPYDARHAVTIVGYKVDAENVVYVHDDRLGPYARAKLVELKDYDAEIDGKTSWALGLQRMLPCKTAWSEPHEIIVPEFLAILSDKKARLPFYYAEYTCEVIESRFQDIMQAASKGGVVSRLTHEVTLREVSEIRQELRSYQAPLVHIDDASSERFEVTPEEFVQWKRDKVKFLTDGFARLQWQAQFFLEGQKAFKVYIDASDIPQGNAISAIFVDNIVLANPILELFKKYGASLSTDAASGYFYEAFLRYLRGREQTFMDYLDETYGALRAPFMLKEQEFKGGDIYTNDTLQVLYDRSPEPLSLCHERFSDPDVTYLIWAIANDGALLIGEEISIELDGESKKCGHPCITKFRPARVAGEIWKTDDAKCWKINSKSARYSGDYGDVDRLLENARLRFEAYFPGHCFEAMPWP